MNTLTVKVKTVTEHTEQRPAVDVLMDKLCDLRAFTAASMCADGPELDLYESGDNGLMVRYKTLTKKEMDDKDFTALANNAVDFAHDENVKRQCCELLAKYADKFECEHGVVTQVVFNNMV